MMWPAALGLRGAISWFVPSANHESVCGRAQGALRSSLLKEKNSMPFETHNLQVSVKLPVMLAAIAAIAIVALILGLVKI
jgi:hypothetical protein